MQLSFDLSARTIHGSTANRECMCSLTAVIAFGSIMERGDHLAVPPLRKRRAEFRELVPSRDKVVSVVRRLGDAMITAGGAVPPRGGKPQKGTRAHMISVVGVPVGLLVFNLPAATAEVAAWCAVIKGGEYWDCPYRSFEDCYSNVVGGTRGYCNPSPYYVAGSAEQRQTRKRRTPSQ